MPKHKIEKFKIIGFDGEDYELQNFSFVNGMRAKNMEEQLSLKFAAGMGVPDLIGKRCDIVFASCKDELKIGSVVKGYLEGNPKELAAKGKTPKFVLKKSKRKRYAFNNL